jgi:hypothetical protein
MLFYFLKVESMLVASSNTAITIPKSKRNNLATSSSGVNHDRIAAERTQIYERLSLSSSQGSAEHINAIFSRFAIPLTEKKKKAFLTEALCKLLASLHLH